MSWDYGCQATGKRRYPTMGDLRKALQGLKNRQRKVKSYRCADCHGYHMTHYLHETRDRKVARTVFKRGAR